MLKNRTWLAPLLVTAGGFALRARDIDAFWINPDEGLRYFIAHASLPEATHLVLINAHPPLYSVLLRALAPLSDSIVWLRTPSLLFGSASIAVLYAIGREVGRETGRPPGADIESEGAARSTSATIATSPTNAIGEWCGFVSAALLAVSPGAVMMSQVARPYATELFFVTAAFLFLIRFFNRRRARDAVLYAVALAAAVATHYSALIALAGLGWSFALFVARGRLTRSEARLLALVHVPIAALIGLLYWFHIGPYLVGSALQREAIGNWLAPYLAAAPQDVVANFVGVFGFFFGTSVGGIAALGFLGACAFCALERRATVVWLSASIFAVGIIGAAASLYPFGEVRHILYLAPFACVPIGLATSLIVARGPVAVSIAAAAVGLGVLGGGALGAFPAGAASRAGTYPEFQIPVEEGEWIAGAVNALAETPGVVFMDRMTAFVLSPVLTDARAHVRTLAAPDGDRHSGIELFRHGHRWFVMVGRWNLAVGAPVVESAAHLATAIRALEDAPPEVREALRIDAHLLSAAGGSAARALRRIGRSAGVPMALVGRVDASAHFSLFPFDWSRYLELIEPGSPPG